MKKTITLVTAALAALLCSSCGKYIEEDNVICKHPWQLDSMVTCSNLTFEDLEISAYAPQSEIITFSSIGNWTFSSANRGDHEIGTWATDIIPTAGSNFKMTLTSFNPGIFIEEGHSGEAYNTTISEDGQSMHILHRHTDSTTLKIYYFSQVK